MSLLESKLRGLSSPFSIGTIESNSQSAVGLFWNNINIFINGFIRTSLLALNIYVAIPVGWAVLPLFICFNAVLVFFLLNAQHWILNIWTFNIRLTLHTYNFYNSRWLFGALTTLIFFFRQFTSPLSSVWLHWKMSSFYHQVS